MTTAETVPGDATERVGFVGLGAMGGAIARNLLAHGTPLTVFDVAPVAVESFRQLGAQGAHSLTDLSSCTMVITCLPGAPEFEAVLFGGGGLAEVLDAGSLIIDMTSNDPSVVRSAAQQLAEHGIELVDAPVAGGKASGEKGTLAVAVGGSETAFRRARPVLEQVSVTLVHAGALGGGDVCKLAHNLGIHIVRQALAEMFTLAVKAGVAPEALFEFVSNGAFGRLDQLHSWFVPRILTGDFLEGKPTFRHALALKDIRLAVALAERAEVPLPLGNECLDLAVRASSEGWDDRDAWATFALQEGRAGVEVRTKAQ
jgi:3-hydroxyisobutyrate dehydrogenase